MLAVALVPQDNPVNKEVLDPQVPRVKPDLKDHRVSLALRVLQDSRVAQEPVEAQEPQEHQAVEELRGNQGLRVQPVAQEVQVHKVRSVPKEHLD